MIERRFFVEPEAIDAAETVAVLKDEEHHHLSRVLRLHEGDEVSVFDGAGRGFKAIIDSIARRETRVRLTAPDRREVEPAFRVTLAQGIPHHDRMELIVQKTTEIGVAAVVPIVAERTVVRPGRDGGWTRLERWRRVARDAARQSGRLVVPEIAEPIEWREYLERLPRDGASSGFLLDPEGVLSADDGPVGPGAGAHTAVVAVGPEGGWTQREAALGREHGLRPVGVGPRILRTETAGIVAVALVLYLAGELGGPRPG